jgi:hypothetical protein
MRYQIVEANPLDASNVTHVKVAVLPLKKIKRGSMIG